MSHALRTFAEVPLVLFAAAFAAAWLLLRRASHLARFTLLAGAGSGALLLMVCLLQAFSTGFFVSFGANVLGVAAAHRNGQQMYHAFAAPARYSLLYGPYTFLVYEPLLHSFNSLTWIKLSIFGVDAATLGIIVILLRQRLPAYAAAALSGVFAAMLLAIPNGLLGIRGDMWAVLAISIALLAVRLRSPLVSPLMAGLCCGFAIGVKATLAAEALLLLALVWRRHGARAAALCASVTALVAMFPFAFSSISLRNYVELLRLTGQREMLPSLLVANALFAVLVLAPGVLFRVLAPQPERRSGRLLYVLFGGALLVALLTGSKSGGGPWHLWPLLPFAAVWAADWVAVWVADSAADAASVRTSGRVDLILAALALAALATSLRFAVRAVLAETPHLTVASHRLQASRLQELAGLLKQYPERALELAPGASLTSDADDLRYVLVAAGQPYQVDMITAAEDLKLDQQYSPALEQELLGCGPVWLVTHGESPFSTRNNNEVAARFPYLFTGLLRKGFPVTYGRVQQGISYDVWDCRSASKSNMRRMLP